jgi:zinc protease
MMLEGTSHYTAQELTHKLDMLGITLESEPGKIVMSMLSKRIPEALDILYDILNYALFDKDHIEKVREHIFSDLKYLWDTPSKFSHQLAQEAIYHNHPFSKSIVGTRETIARITQTDLKDFYDQYANPVNARLSIVGDIESYDIADLIEHKLGKWSEKEPICVNMPDIEPVEKRTISYPMNRDQVVLCFVGLSVTKSDNDFDALLIYDQIFTGGILGSMSSQLFDLREQTGLFYTIGGSLLYKVNKQKGMIFVKTIVSPDRLDEAEKSIANIINTGYKEITDDAFYQAKQAIINSLVDNFSTNYRIAETLLFLDSHDLPFTYFDTRADELERMTKDDVQKAVSCYLNTDNMITIKVGRTHSS